MPPVPVAGLEDACAPGTEAVAAMLYFLLQRARAISGAALIGLVAGSHWQSERGRLYAPALARVGIAPSRLLLVSPADDDHGLWALEEMLRSGEVGFAIGAIDRPSLTATRRLDHAARGASAGVTLVRCGSGQALSAARRRWRISPLASPPHHWDRRAPGPPAWRAELLRRRDGVPGAWDLEWCDEAHRLTVARRLAGNGLAADAGGAPRPAAA